MEEQKGVSGFHDTQEELEKVSSVKSGLDEQKGKSLDEISDMVSRTMIFNYLWCFLNSTTVHVAILTRSNLNHTYATGSDYGCGIMIGITVTSIYLQYTTAINLR